MTIKNIGLAALVLAALLGVAAFFGFGISMPTHTHTLGTAGNAPETYYNGQWLVGGVQIGPTGTWNTNTQFGTCNLIGGSAGISATSTKNFDCAVTGVLAGDVVMVDPGSNTPITPTLGFLVTKAVASTTNGYITISVANLSGAASTTLGTNLTNGIEYMTWR